MANLVQAAKDQIQSLIADAYARAVESGSLPAGIELGGTIEAPKDPTHGDYASSCALAAAKAARMAPRKIADALISELRLEGSYFSSVEAAGAGFINFRLAPSWFAAVLSSIEAEGLEYGHTDFYGGNEYPAKGFLCTNGKIHEKMLSFFHDYRNLKR